MRVLILPHFVVGVCVVLALIFQLMWMAFGSEIQGEVTGTRQSTSKNVTSYFIEYRYPWGEDFRTDKQKVSAAVQQRFVNLKGLKPEERVVTVRHFSIGPVHQARLPGYGSVWPIIGFLVVFGAFWNGVAGIFVYQLWVKPIMIRRLYINGEPARGRVVSKDMKTGKSTTYTVRYVFVDSVTGEEVKGEMDTIRGAWATAEAGQEVTVLYNPARPRSSVVYELGPWVLAEV